MAGDSDAGALRMEEVVADKGYHSGAVLADLEAMELRGYISEPDRGRRRWAAHNAEDREFKRAEQRAVYRNRRRRRGERSKRLHRKRGELVERTFDHMLDDGGMRRAHLRGREKITKRYLVHVAAFNLGLILRALLGFGTPKGWADGPRGCLLRWMRAVGRSWERVGAFGRRWAPTWLAPRARRLALALAA